MQHASCFVLSVSASPCACVRVRGVRRHHTHLFSCQITEAELETVREAHRQGKYFGNIEETERTYVEVISLRDAIPNMDFDFATLGQIMHVIGLWYDTKARSSAFVLPFHMSPMAYAGCAVACVAVLAVFLLKFM